MQDDAGFRHLVSRMIICIRPASNTAIGGGVVYGPVHVVVAVAALTNTEVLCKSFRTTRRETQSVLRPEMVGPRALNA